MMRIRFWCNHCGEFDKSVTIELDEIGAYTIAPKFCPKCMFVLKHADVEDMTETTDAGVAMPPGPEAEITLGKLPDADVLTKTGNVDAAAIYEHKSGEGTTIARPTVTKQNEQTANDNKADAQGTVS